MNDRFETTFVVDVAPAAAWAAIARRDVVEHDKTRSADASAGQVWLPGFESTAEILESIPGRLLRVRKDRQPCEGTEIVVTLQAEASGTKITVVQSGFGAFFDAAANWLGVGWDLIVRDLILYVERGVIAHRHMNAWGPSPGFNFIESPSGLVVSEVFPGSAAATAGLKAGDHILTLCDAPVATTRDLAMVMRAEPRGEIRFKWLRSKEAMSGAGALT